MFNAAIKGSHAREAAERAANLKECQCANRGAFTAPCSSSFFFCKGTEMDWREILQSKLFRERDTSSGKGFFSRVIAKQRIT